MKSQFTLTKTETAEFINVCAVADYPQEDKCDTGPCAARLYRDALCELENAERVELIYDADKA